LGQGLFDVFNFERFDNGFDFFHGKGSVWGDVGTSECSGRSPEVATTGQSTM
jgi:hypothetical protein